MLYHSKLRQLEVLRSQLDYEFSSFRSQYQDLNDYILPSRGRFFISDNNRGDRRNHKIYDNTGYMAARTLSSGMMAGITSPARNWKRLTTQDPELAEFGPVKEWLHLVDSRMSTEFLRSNLYNVLPSLYGDLGVFGTSAMLMEEDQDATSRFYSLPIGMFRIGKDARGIVNVCMREFRMTVRQLVERFGRITGTRDIDWTKLSMTVKGHWDKSEYETWIDVVHIIQPNNEFDERRAKLNSKFKKFASTYYERGTSKGDRDAPEKFLRESGYDYFPVLAPRWQVTGMDVYGTDCPGMVAIGDIKQLQHGEKRVAQAIDKMVNPAMVASSSLKTQKASIISGDITYLDDLNRDGFRAAHEVRIDVSHIENKQEQARGRIRRAFFEDLFLMLASSDRREYTATEIVERKEEKLLAVGPVLEQLNQDVLDPLIDNQFALMLEQGLIPPPPPELEGQDLKIEYTSIMSQAQKMVGIGGLDRLLQVAPQVMQLDPSARHKFDFHQIVDEYAESLGTSPRVVRSDEDVEKLVAAEQQAAAAQQRMEMLNQGAQVAKDLSGASLEGDNALTALREQMTGQLG